MNTTELLSHKLRNVASEAALSVGDYLREFFRSEHTTDFKRDPRDVVTAADKETEKRLIAFILDREPNSQVLGEEGGATGHGDIQWYIDPIDGTGNFSTGVAFWCVSIAAAIEGEVIAAAVYDPIADDLFSADLEGAYLNGQRLKPRQVRSEERAVITTNYPAPRQLKKHGEITILQIAKLMERYFAVKRIGSAALSLCYIAAGWFDATFGTGVNPWDVAAAGFIVKQSGGIYTPYRNTSGQAQDYFAPMYAATLAGAEFPVFDEVMETIAEIEYGPAQ